MPPPTCTRQLPLASCQHAATCELPICLHQLLLATHRIVLFNFCQWSTCTQRHSNVCNHTLPRDFYYTPIYMRVVEPSFLLIAPRLPNPLPSMCICERPYCCRPFPVSEHRRLSNQISNFSLHSTTLPLIANLH